MADRFGHIKINGEYYRVELKSAGMRDVIDFSPRASVPGGSTIHSELNLYQPIVITDFRHGFGFNWHTDVAGYMRTEGRVDTRHEGVVMLFTDATASDTDNNRKNGFVVHGDYVFSYGLNGVRRFGPTTWADKSPVASTAVNGMWSSGNSIVALVDGMKCYRSEDNGDTWATAGVNANAVDYHWMTHHDGTIYAGKQMTTGLDHGNEVYYTEDEDLSSLHGDPDDDTNELYVGPSGTQVLGAISFLGDLILFRTDGIYKMDKDKTIARLVVSYKDQVDDGNFRSWGIFNNLLIFAIRDRVYQWNGLRLTDITPPRISDSFPYTTYGRYDNIVVVGGYLYMTARTNETTFKEALLCYDGVGWFHLTDVCTNGTDYVSAMHYDPGNNYFWYHVVSAASNTTSYIPFQALSPFPYAAFPTTGDHAIVTSRMAGGYRRIIKSTPSLLIEASNIDTDRYLLVYYALDGAAWVAWGGTDGTTNKITADGITELDNPLGQADTFSTIEYHYMQIKVKLVTASAAQSPILEGITLRAMMRPDTYYGYNFIVVAASNPEYGTGRTEQRTAKQIMDDLKTARASYAPIEFVDLWGTTHDAYITAINTRPVEEHAERIGSVPNIEHVVQVNLVEVA